MGLKPGIAILGLLLEGFTLPLGASLFTASGSCLAPDGEKLINHKHNTGNRVNLTIIGSINGL